MSFLSQKGRVAGDGSWSTVYTMPTDGVYSFGIISVGVANVNTTSGSTTKIDIAITSSATPQPSDYIEYQTDLLSGASGYERSGIHIKPGDKIVVKSSADPVDVRVNGLLYNSTIDDIVSVSDTSTSGSWKEIYTVPANTPNGSVQGATLNITLVNASGTAITADLAIAAATPPEDGSYLTRGMSLASFGDGAIYGYKALVVGEKVLVKADTASLAVRVDGLLSVG